MKKLCMYRYDVNLSSDDPRMSTGGLSEHDDKPSIFVSSDSAFDCLNSCPLPKVDCTKGLVS